MRKIYYSEASDGDLVEVVADLLKSTAPMEPIVFSVNGELLVDVPKVSRSMLGPRFLLPRTRDAHVLQMGRLSEIGRHEVCGGNIHIFPVSKTNLVFVCAGCNLRIVIPASITTYGGLRKHFEAVLSNNGE
jgi:hypothetical protein